MNWYNKLTPLQQFLVKAVLLYFSWEILYTYVLGENGPVDEFFTSTLSEISAWYFRTVGYEGTEVYVYERQPGINAYFILMKGTSVVQIEDGCNGLILMVLFAGFIIAFPGDWKKKLWYIPLGTIAIYVLNLIRIQVLIYNILYFHSSFQFNHKYTYTIAVYGCIFAFWILWVNRFSGFKLEAAEESKEA